MKQPYPKNTKNCFLTLLAFVSVSFLYGQEYRTIDGTGNNLANPTWGAVEEDQLRMMPSEFADGIGEPAGDDRPNPRTISNVIFSQPDALPDPMGLSDYAWVFGQLIDHDITLVPNNADERMDISVPLGDPVFDPLGTGFLSLKMSRSKYNPNTGHLLNHPREYPNEITAFIDGSMVYGSDEYRASWLRSFRDGKLRTSTGDLLPYNTVSGELGSIQDLLAPPMDNENPYNSKLFVAGDVRANENPLLTTLHTLFVREHNRLCDELKADNPDWDDEMLYQRARKILGGIIQAITYEEWLPTMGLRIPPYTGYDSSVNPGIMNVFSVAAFRFGHTLLNGTILRMDNDGSTMPVGNLSLRNAFFNPAAIQEMGDIYSYLVGMGVQVQQSFDAKVIDDIRNFLFGPPGQGGLDLAAININRGRDRGLPDYNSIRKAIGKAPISDFSELCRDEDLNERLRDLYENNVDNIDAWVGLLAEDRIRDDALFGESVMAILEDQFRKLRDGDRFYYENDPDLTIEEKEEIKNTTLADVIMRNSSVDYMQGNVFVAEERVVTSYAANDLPVLGMSVYPNPVTSNFYLQLDLEEDGLAQVQITNMMGQVMTNRAVQVRNGENIIPMSVNADLAGGIYQVGVSLNGKYGVKKLVVSH